MSRNFTAEMRDFGRHIISVVRNPQQRATKRPPVETTGGRFGSIWGASAQRGEGGSLLTDQGHLNPAILLAAGRNLAVLVEAAVRNRVLQLRGIDSTSEFIARQAQELNGGGESDMPH